LKLLGFNTFSDLTLQTEYLILILGGTPVSKQHSLATIARLYCPFEFKVKVMLLKNVRSGTSRIHKFETRRSGKDNKNAQKINCIYI